MNTNSKKETIKQVVLSVALMNMLAASNVAVAAISQIDESEKQEISSNYEVTDFVSGSQTEGLFNGTCNTDIEINGSCKIVSEPKEATKPIFEPRFEPLEPRHPRPRPNDIA